MKPITPDALIAAMRARGHVVFERGELNLNIVGLRAVPGQPNAFDDRLCLLYRTTGHGWILETFAATTDPGRYYLRAPMNVRGTAIVCPGQYRGSHAIGTHKGYPALQQVGPLKVWRDANRNEVLDMAGPTHDAVGAGLNIHHAGPASTTVDRWSAGCQVIARLDDWRRFWTVVQAAAKVWGPRFSYTLLEWPAG